MVEGNDQEKYKSIAVVNLPPGYTIGQTSATVFVTKVADILLRFRSKQTGSWNDISTWESSADGVNWSNSIQTPSSFNAELITVRNPHMVTVTTNTIVNELMIENGGTLNISTGTLTIVK